MMDASSLSKATGASITRASQWLPALIGVMALHDISTPARQASFLAQLGHESGGLNRVEESFNYTPAGILSTFNTKRIQRFTPGQAELYGRTAAHPANKVMIGSIAYADRMGNGDINSREGYLYRGRGPIQLTGKHNMKLCGEALGLDLVGNPDLLLDISNGAMAAGWFWTEGNATGKSLNILADAGQFQVIGTIINGGFNGREERLHMTAANLELFNQIGVA